MKQSQSSLQKITDSKVPFEAKPDTAVVRDKVLIMGNREALQCAITDVEANDSVELILEDSVSGALGCARSHPISAAIIDLTHDGNDSAFWVSKAIRLLPGNAELPLAFIGSDSIRLNDVDRVFEGGSVELTHPVSAIELNKALQVLLSARQSQVPRILLVNGDDALCKFIATVLTNENMLVKSLTKPIEIMSSLEEFDPDLAILDAHMAGVSAYDVCRLIKETDHWRNIPILFLTPEGNAEERLTAFEAGGDDFMTKPIVMAE